MKVSKQGSTLAGIMDAFSIAVSLGLQHGVPLSTYVRKYTNMRFEPAGITDDADLRIATSLVDYIFRRLALDYLSETERSELGVLSTSERMQPTLPGMEDAGVVSSGIQDDPIPGVATVIDAGTTDENGIDIDGSQRGTGDNEQAKAHVKDAPMCYECGNVMQPSGSCYVCTSCGTTSGCS